MESKPKPTLALSQPSLGRTAPSFTSHIHWLEPLGQLEKLAGPSFTETMAVEGEEPCAEAGDSSAEERNLQPQEVQSSLGSCHSKPTSGFLPGLMEPLNPRTQSG